ETRVSVRLTMPNDDADASAACRHVAGPWTGRCPASYPWCIVVLVVAGTSQQLRHEAFQASSLRHAARPGDPRRVVVRIEVSGDEAHLIVGRHAEVYGVIVGIRPLAREAYALARQH